MKKIMTEIYSRVCGFYRPVSQYNFGKKSEFAERKVVDSKNLDVMMSRKKDKVK